MNQSMNAQIAGSSKTKKRSAKSSMNAGGAIFTRLKALGIEYVFVNSGTDFPPIVEGLAEAEAKGVDLPKALNIPHEHCAMGMAHGYYFISGKSPAVILHTNVGLANGATGAINAAMDHVPMLLMSGRTPGLEGDRFGARTVPIGWGQEMKDQTSLIRESVKWDYELRFPEQVEEVFDRAYSISNSTPKGPTYISLPREVLCEEVDAAPLSDPLRMAPAKASPDAQGIKQAAELIANAKKPLLISQRGAGSYQGFAALSQLVDDWAIPVSNYWAVKLPVPMNHPMQVGADPKSWIEEADVIVVIDSLAPWWPDLHQPSDDCKVIHVGPNPLYNRTPIRNFRSDVSLVGETDTTIFALAEALEPLREDKEKTIQQRYARVSAEAEQIRKKVDTAACLGMDNPMTKEWVSKCIGSAIADHEKVSVLSELGAPLAPIELKHHNSWFQEPHSGGLGWCLPASLGMKLAEPDRLVIATMGDGSYMFANPTACHQVGEALGLGTVTLILNNEEYGAVKQSIVGMYPNGYAAKAKEVPLTSLQPTPDFTLTAQASRCYAEKVTDGKELPAALRRAIKVATEENRQAVLDIKIRK